jgi:hypothetical protein
MLTDSEFLDDRDIPRDCEHGTLAKQCELCECKKELAAVNARLERAMKVVEASEAAMCIEFPKPLRDAMQRWWDEEAGR